MSAIHANAPIRISDDEDSYTMTAKDDHEESLRLARSQSRASWWGVWATIATGLVWPVLVAVVTVSRWSSAVENGPSKVDPNVARLSDITEKLSATCSKLMYVNLEDKTQMAELRGEVNRLQRSVNP